MSKWPIALTISILLSFSIHAEKTKKYKDGVYYGAAKGYEGPVKVKVEVKNGKIKNVKIIKEKESAPKAAFKKIPSKIIKKQKIKVDIVSGATVTSNAIIKAVKDALKKAVAKK